MKRSGRGSWIENLRRHYQLYLLALPAIVFYIVFYYAPMYGVQIAFRDYIPTMGISGSPWVGLKHFEAFVTSFQFAKLIRNTLSISISVLLFGFPAPIILALCINELQHVKFRKAVQTLTYAPNFISVVVLVGMMTLFLSPVSGVINRLIVLLGGTAENFMGKNETFVPVYVISNIWKTTGWNSVIYVAALTNISQELHDAAQIDGASRLQRIRHINIPGIAPTIIILLILNSGQIMTVGFEKVFLMQNALNAEVSEIISTYVYKRGILGAQFSFSSAVGLFNSVINCVLLFSVNSISKRVSETSLW